MSADKSDTPRTDALLSGIDSFGRIPTMEDRFQRMCRHARHLEREVTALTAANADLTAQLAEARRDADRFDWIISKLADGESIEFDPKWMHPLTSRENKKSGLITAIDTEIAAMKETK